MSQFCCNRQCKKYSVLGSILCRKCQKFYDAAKPQSAFDFKVKYQRGARRKERAAAGRPLITLSIQQSTLDKLVRLSRMLGMSRSDTIAFLIDNRPDVLYSPEVAAPRRESEECAKHGRVGCLECGMKEFGER